MSINVDVPAAFASATALIDYIHSYSILNTTITVISVIAAILLALVLYWQIASGSGGQDA